MMEAKCFKADSGTEENGITPTLVGDHNSRVSDQSVLILEPKFFNWHSQSVRAYPITDDVAPCIPAAMGMGGPNMTTPILIAEPVGVDMYNQTITGGVSMTVKSTLGGDSRPCVIEVIPMEGNGSRPPHQGNGYGAEGDPMFTLNTTEVHGVAYGVTKGGGQAGQGFPCVCAPDEGGDSRG